MIMKAKHAQLYFLIKRKTNKQQITSPVWGNNPTDEVIIPQQKNKMAVFPWSLSSIREVYLINVNHYNGYKQKINGYEFCYENNKHCSAP